MASLEIEFWSAFGMLFGLIVGLIDMSILCLVYNTI